MNNLKTTNSIFENMKHIDEEDNEYWSARELQKALEYSQWRRFESVIKKAMKACKNSKNNINEHFANVGKLSKRNNNANVCIDDYKLSRYACYLIAQNADSRKKVVAYARTYFAYQTRKQELLEQDYNILNKNKKES